ncbi:sigma-E factor regulatory protein RseB domain-containing protein [Saccharothrix mutabilis subsp. mutabilis]|uniref:Sigma-E factor regulatory protein RseB domain-containing protein n=1 Tax=Saccharothrix mutabilis subsp. mutabilis TaxID=66855 RepID=A0ABN0T8P2_9PSEU
MNRRRVTVVAAAVGVVAGVAGLGVLAMPAGAGPAPELPAVEAEALVESVLSAKPAAFGGAVSVSNDLGVPGISGLPQLSDGDSELRVWTDGAGRVRVQLPAADSERTFVDDGQTGWLWDSADQQVTKLAHGELEEPRLQLDPNAPQVPADPVAVAREAVAKIKEFSDVSVDGTARVADRPAYELVLTPKPTERTVLREVRVAVDSELRIPLRFEVLTNGTAAPAVQIGFSELNVGPQDAALFSFTPPPGAKVSEPELRGPTAEEKALAEGAFAEANPQIVGEGWDQVLVARMPADALKNLAQKQGEGREWEHEGRPGQDVDVEGLLKQLGKQVSGPWGSGTLITTRVGAALIADDGRVAAGAVPEQVLVEAIGQVK